MFGAPVMADSAMDAGSAAEVADQYPAPKATCAEALDDDPNNPLYGKVPCDAQMLLNVAQLALAEAVLDHIPIQ